MAGKKKNIDKNSIFYQRFRELYNTLDYSHNNLAQELGVCRQTIASWLDGKSAPDIIALEKIARFFKVSADYLLGLSNTTKADVRLQSAVEYTGLSEKAVEWLHDGLLDKLDLFTDENYDKEKKENLQAASRLICTWYFTNMVQPLKSIADEAHFEELLSILRKQHCKPITVHHDNFQFENNEDRQVVIHHLTHARKALHPDDPAVEQVATMSDSELLTLLVKTIGSFRRDSEIHQFNAAKAFNSYLDQVIADSKNAVKESLKPQP